MRWMVCIAVLGLAVSGCQEAQQGATDMTPEGEQMAAAEAAEGAEATEAAVPEEPEGPDPSEVFRKVDEFMMAGDTNAAIVALEGALADEEFVGDARGWFFRSLQRRG